MIEFKMYNYYPTLREEIIKVITEKSKSKLGSENIYPLVYSPKFDQKLSSGLEQIITIELLHSAITERFKGPWEVLSKLKLKEYWMVMDPKDRKRQLIETQFYKTKLFDPFNQIGEEDEVESFYESFHNYFIIPTIIIWERALHKFLMDLLKSELRIMFIYPGSDPVQLENEFVLNNLYDQKLDLVKWGLTNIIEAKWVLLYVNEYNNSLFEIEPDAPSVN